MQLLKELSSLNQQVSVQSHDDTRISERYEGSSDFDADMVAIQTKLQEIKKIMLSQNWIQHMRDTESNFEVDGLGTAENHLFSSIEEAVDAAEEFYELIQQAT